MDTKASPDNAKPCPWCGSRPRWLSKRMDYGTGASGMEAPMRALGCDDKGCGVKPSTKWCDTQEWTQGRGHFDVDYDSDAIRDWNARKA